VQEWSSVEEPALACTGDALGSVVCLEANVVVAALPSPRGASAQVLVGWADGGYELIVSPLLVAELEGVPWRPRFAGSISPTEIDGLLDALREDAPLHGARPPNRSSCVIPKTTISWLWVLQAKLAQRRRAG
jgi:hypothetical protein